MGKLFSKLSSFITPPKGRPVVEHLSGGTVKKAYIRKSFQVEGITYSLEFIFEQKVNVIENQFHLSKEPKMIKHNSRSFQGGLSFTTFEDVSQILGLTLEETKSIFSVLEKASRMTKTELESAKKACLRKIKSSETKLH